MYQAAARTALDTGFKGSQGKAGIQTPRTLSGARCYSPVFPNTGNPGATLRAGMENRRDVNHRGKYLLRPLPGEQSGYEVP